MTILFYIKTSGNFLSRDVKKLINLKINSCSAPNWTICNSLDYSIWSNQQTCPDSIYESIFGEQWDDGNSQSGDGWSSTCMIESGYTCTTISTRNDISYWVKSWGNGYFDDGEEWDDGNLISGDGWDEKCK